MIRVHRAYDQPVSLAGRRFLVDRLWPRGIRKADLALEGWLKATAPSNELRHWYHDNPQQWELFRQRYFAELEENPQAWQPLADAAREGDVVLIYSSREVEHNNAVALKEFLEARL